MELTSSDMLIDKILEDQMNTKSLGASKLNGLKCIAKKRLNLHIPGRK
jgi:hypothetical protein